MEEPTKNTWARDQSISFPYFYNVTQSAFKGWKEKQRTGKRIMKVQLLFYNLWARRETQGVSCKSHNSV